MTKVFADLALSADGYSTGPNQSEEHPFLGKEMHEARQFSEETAHVIDQEVQRFLNDASTQALLAAVEHGRLARSHGPLRRLELEGEISSVLARDVA